jgi:hypothetical protein
VIQTASYFGTLDGQIYTSTDGARNWRLLVNFNRPQLFVDHIIVDPRNPKVLYVATHRHKEPGGFFKSKDGGLTWREAPELRNQALHSMTQSEANPNMLLVGTITGIYRSNDSGETWFPLPAIPKAGTEVDVESLAIDPRNSDVIYAGTWYLPTRAPMAVNRGRLSRMASSMTQTSLRSISTPQRRPLSSRPPAAAFTRLVTPATVGRRSRAFPRIPTYARDSSAPISAGFGFCRHDRRLLAVSKWRRK